MPSTRVRDAAARATNLIPFDAGTLKGDYAAVCSPAERMPYALQAAQQARTTFYMAGNGRSGPAFAPRYYLTSGKGPAAELIAYVSMDGRVHYPTVTAPLAIRHQQAMRAALPTRFAPFSD